MVAYSILLRFYCQLILLIKASNWSASVSLSLSTSNLAAAIVSGIIGDLTDTLIILAIVFINALVGLIQEHRAEKAMEALKKMATNYARILREGKTMDIPTYNLVPGDVVVLEAGNVIPADIRFFEIC